MITIAPLRKITCHIVILLLTVCAPLFVRAQLVADGQTDFLDNITTNIAGGVTVGTNGSFTLLVVTNGATVTNNGGTVVIGANASAQSNSLVVTGTGSAWNSANNFEIGGSGSFNQLNVLDGAVVTGAAGYIGFTGNSSSNISLVSDPGSLWQATTIQVGYLGLASYNQLIVSNGATVAAHTCTIGPNPGSNNIVVVTGPGSVFTNSGALNLSSGYGTYVLLLVTNGGNVFSGTSSIGGANPSAASSVAIITGTGSAWNSGYFTLGGNNNPLNLLTINNGGAFASSGTCDVGVYCNSNVLTVADSGSSLQCPTFRIGYSSAANQCVVSNGALFTVTSSGSPAATIEGTFTRAAITGAGTLWTNVGDFDFGQYSNALVVTAGAVLADNNGYIESGSGKPNSAVVAGANSLWKNSGDFHMADSGARLLITNGGALIDNNGYFGDATSGFSNTNSFALVAGPGSIWTNHAGLYIGYSGASNQVFITDSATVNAGAISLGPNGNGNQLIVSNSAFVGTTALSIGTSTSVSNILTLAGGTIAVTNLGGNGVVISNGKLVLNSGLFMVHILHVNFPSGNIIFNGGTLQSGSTSYANNAPFTVGDGTDSAVFQLLGGTHSFSSGLIVSGNGVLGGSGTISANISVNSGGTIAPGTNNIATITANSGVTLNPGSTTLMKLNTSSLLCDALTGMTNITYGGSLQLSNVVAFPFQNRKSFKLFTANNYSGAFAALVPSSPGAGLRWDTNELNVDGVLRVFSIPTPKPVITGITAANGNLVLTAANGIPYDPCYLLTSTNLATPLAQWSIVATNYFDTFNSTSFTNSISPDQPQQFFQIQVN